MRSHLSAQQLLAPLALGWNLGNTLDAYDEARNLADETLWGNPAADAALFHAVARAGFQAVRIPVTWLGHVGPAAQGYPVSRQRLARVAEVVRLARQAGLVAVVNLHHDGAESKYWLNVRDAATDPAQEAAIRQRLVAMWTQIAQALGHHGDGLIFELFNEVHDGGWGWGANLRDNGRQYAVLNGWTQAALDAIRATGGHNRQRLVVVTGYSADPRLTLDHLQLPTDPTPDRLVVSIHCYHPVEFAIQAKTSTWGHRSPNAFNRWQERDLLALLDDVHAKWVARGVPVIVGEYGAVRQDADPAWRLYYLEFITKAMHDRQLLPFYWDNGIATAGAEAFGLLDRRQAQPLPDATAVLQVLTRAAGLSPAPAGYSLAQVQARAPGHDPADEE